MANVYQIDPPKNQCHRKSCNLSDADLQDLLATCALLEEDRQILRSFNQAVQGIQQAIELKTVELLKKHTGNRLFNDVSETTLLMITSQTVLSIIDCSYNISTLRQRLLNFRQYQQLGINIKNFIFILKNIFYAANYTNNHIWTMIDQSSLSCALQKCIQLEYALFAQCAVCRVITSREQQKIAFEKHNSLIKRKFTERHNLLESEVKKDTLTDLFNGRELENALHKTLLRARQNNMPFSVVFMDVNDFKVVNDTHGHVYGDHILKECANLIKASCRSADMAFRYGGDEFFAILPDCNKAQSLEHFINRLRDLIHQRLPDISISCGVVEIDPQSNWTVTDIIHLADTQMYQSKRQHKLRHAS